MSNKSYQYIFVLATCAQPPAPRHGGYRFPSRASTGWRYDERMPFGTVVVFACRSPYNYLSVPRAVCNATGNWSPDPPTACEIS